VLETINNRIEVLIDRDHTIGHSYFMGLEAKANIVEATKSVFRDKVIPLLQEYFFNDYGKIQLVLGKGFIKKKYENLENFDFAENETDLTKGDFEDRPIFELVDLVKLSSKDFIKALKDIGVK
jgi:5-methylcytosine-specific restriction protein B